MVEWQAELNAINAKQSTKATAQKRTRAAYPVLCTVLNCIEPQYNVKSIPLTRFMSANKYRDACSGARAFISFVLCVNSLQHYYMVTFAEKPFSVHITSQHDI